MGEQPEQVESGDGSQRARLAIALGGTFLLAVIVGVVIATRESDKAPAAATGTCFVAWNEDPVAPRQDGIHAYQTHGYRQTLVTRISPGGEILEAADDGLAPDDPEARCAVIFASPQVDDEPDFGVRVLDGERWTGLSLTKGTKLEDIARLQGEAVATSNALLGSGGLLTED